MRIPRARILGLSAAIAAAALTTAVPAQAADTRLTFDITDSVQIPAKPAAAGQFGENVHLRIGRTGTGTAHGVKVAFDTSGLAGLAELTVPGCATAGTVITCDVGDLNFDSINITKNPWLSAVAGAKSGSSGRLRITLTASDAQTATKDIRVDVGGADFKAKELPQLKGVKPGSTVAPAVEFANVGDVAAGRVVVAVDAISGLDFKKHPSNCEFATASDGSGAGRTWPGDTMAVCTLDTAVAPGAVLTLDPVQFGVTDSAWYSFADISLYTAEDAQYSDIPLWRKNHRFTRGTDSALAAAKTTDPALLTAPRTPYDNRVEQEVTAANTADFSALAAWAPAAGGKRGTLSIGYRNSGPASIFYRSGNAVVTVQAQIPKGVKVTTVPSGCRARTWEAGHQVADPDKYLCDSSMWVPSGSQAVFAFGLALDGTPATVPVTLQDESSLSGDRPAAELAFDPKHANDATSVTLGSTPSGSLPSASPSSTPGGATATPPAVVRPTGSATPSAPPTTPSATATTSGGLAFTGATGIGPMLGIGVAAVALGGGVLVAVRRRKAGSHH